MTLALALPVLAALALAALSGRRRARALERAVSAKLPLGPEGVIVGAEPIRREGTRGDAVLLLHGFGDTPQALRYLADALHGRGWTVHAPLLPGHGRTLRDFAGSGAAQWERAAVEAYDALRARHERVAVVGLSMGGALAVLCARRDPSLRSLVLLAPYLAMPPRIRTLAVLHPLWAPFAPFVPSGGGAASIHDAEELARSRAYGAVCGSMLRELSRVVDRAAAALPSLRAPTLVVHAREDHRIHRARAERMWARLGASERRLVWVERSGHLVTVDHERERVIELTVEWLERFARAPLEAPRKADTPAAGATPVAS